MVQKSKGGHKSRSVKKGKVLKGECKYNRKDNYKSKKKNGMIVSVLVSGLGTTLKYFFKKGDKIFLEAANSNYDPIVLSTEEVIVQGKLLAVWRKSY